MIKINKFYELLFRFVCRNLINDNFKIKISQLKYLFKLYNISISTFKSFYLTFTQVFPEFFTDLVSFYFQQNFYVYLADVFNKD